MKNRLKEIRKDAELTQSAFAERLGLKQNTIASYEMGRIGVSDAVIISICREFNVNEKWLRTGEGEMYAPQTHNQEIIEFVNQVMADENESFRKRFVTALAKAKPEFWDELDRILDESLKKD